MRKALLFLCFAVFLVGAVQLNAVTIPGTWDFYYDWGCDGGHGSTTITFTYSTYVSTFTTGNGNSGEWYQKDEDVHIYFYNLSSNVIYVGQKVGNTIFGVMKAGETVTGCWYAKKRGIVGSMNNRDEAYKVIDDILPDKVK